MDDRLMINRPVSPSTRVNKQNTVQESKDGQEKSSFKKILVDKLENESEISFSRHAQKRIVSRGIELTEEKLEQLEKGVEKLKEKGARESLVLLNEVAYVVSIENDTVITAVDEENVKENIFTNIDSAVLM